jgi:MFS family permease
MPVDVNSGGPLHKSHQTAGMFETAPDLRSWALDVRPEGPTVAVGLYSPSTGKQLTISDSDARSAGSLVTCAGMCGKAQFGSMPAEMGNLAVQSEVAYCCAIHNVRVKTEGGLLGSRISLRRTFQALGNHHYRWLWLGRLASSGTFQMGSVVQGWLVYRLTGSAFALGWVGAGWSVATLTLGLYGGVITDRVDKRTLMFWSRTGMLLSTLVIGLLVAAGRIQVWHLALGSLFNGIFSAFLMPAQQSIVSDLVGPESLMNAMSLDALGMGLMGIFGASLAGAVIEIVGPHAVYFGMAGLYLMALITTLKLPHTPPRSQERRSVRADMMGGARYLRGQPLLILVLLLGLVRVFLVMPYHSLLPAFSRDNLGFDAAGLGMLQSALGLGGLIASLVAGNLGDFQGKGRLLVRSSIVLGLCLILLVSVRWVPAVFLSLVLVGGLGNLYMVLSNTLLLSCSDPAFRGRIVSISMMEWGLMPLGTIPSGAIADRVGVPWVVGVQGALVAIIFALVAWRRPELKQLD